MGASGVSNLETKTPTKISDGFSIAKNENEIGNGYGLGVEKFTTPYGQFIGHTGTAYGFVTLMAYSPSRNSTIVLLLNNQNANVKALAFQAAAIGLKSKGNNK